MVDLTYIIANQLERGEISVSEASGFQEETQKFIDELNEANNKLKMVIEEKKKLEVQVERNSILSKLFKK